VLSSSFVASEELASESGVVVLSVVAEVCDFESAAPLASLVDVVPCWSDACPESDAAGVTALLSLVPCVPSLVSTVAAEVVSAVLVAVPVVWELSEVPDVAVAEVDWLLVVDSLATVCTTA
jgi:hypothetical protein